MKKLSKGKAPKYYHDTIRMASVFLEHDKKQEAHNLVASLEKADYTSGRAAWKVLGKRYGRF